MPNALPRGAFFERTVPVTEFANHLKEWTGRLMSKKTAPGKNQRQSTRAFEVAEGDVPEHHHGAEGHAFQVNGEPEQPNDSNDHHRHGAEGDAFQVNGQPSEIDDDTAEKP